jgi:hypothetical protein
MRRAGDDGPSFQEALQARKRKQAETPDATWAAPAGPVIVMEAAPAPLVTEVGPDAPVEPAGDGTSESALAGAMGAVPTQVAAGTDACVAGAMGVFAPAGQPAPCADALIEGEGAPLQNVPLPSAPPQSAPAEAAGDLPGGTQAGPALAAVDGQPVAAPAAEGASQVSFETLLNAADGAQPMPEPAASAPAPSASAAPSAATAREDSASQAAAQSPGQPAAADRAAAERSAVDRGPVQAIDRNAGAEQNAADAAVEHAQIAAAHRLDPSAAASREPARLAEAPSSDMLRQITSSVHQLAHQQGTTIRLHLHPHELGSIDIRLIHNQNGIGIMVLAEQASTGRLLESQMGQLQQSIADAGVQISQLLMGQNALQDGGQSLFARQGQEAPPPRHTAAQHSEKKQPEGQQQPRKERGASLIDYRV